MQNLNKEEVSGYFNSNEEIEQNLSLKEKTIINFFGDKNGTLNKIKQFLIVVI